MLCFFYVRTLWYFWPTHRTPPTPFNTYSTGTLNQNVRKERQQLFEKLTAQHSHRSHLFSFTELLDGTMVNVSSNYQSSVLRGGPGRPQQSPNHPGQKRDRLAAGLTHPSGGRPVLPTESDSLNENTFPSVPVHRERDREHKTKRKRKCKRFALDPEQQGNSGKPTYPVNSHGRSFTGYSFVHLSFRF